MSDPKQEELFKRFRLVALSNSQKGRPFDSIEHMEEQGILPEFLLVGYMGTNGQPDWQAFLGAELSDPFHSTRITLQYKDYARCEDIEKHSTWFDQAWDNQTQVQPLTREFLMVMTADAQIERDKLLALLKKNKNNSEPEILCGLLS